MPSMRLATIARLSGRVRAFALATGVIVCAPTVVAASASAASAGDWIAFSWKGTSCSSNYPEFHDRVNAQLVVYNRNDNRHYATRLRIKARLVPTSAGWNYTRPWHTSSWPGYSRLNRNRTYSHRLGVNTQDVDGLKAWKLQIKLVWDRSGGWPDVVKQFSRPAVNCTPPVGSG